MRPARVVDEARHELLARSGRTLEQHGQHASCDAFGVGAALGHQVAVIEDEQAVAGSSTSPGLSTDESVALPFRNVPLRLPESVTR